MAGNPMSTAAIPRQAVAIGAAAPVNALPVLAVWLAPAVMVLRVEEEVVEAEPPVTVALPEVEVEVEDVPVLSVVVAVPVVGIAVAVPVPVVAPVQVVDEREQLLRRLFTSLSFLQTAAMQASQFGIQLAAALLLQTQLM